MQPESSSSRAVQIAGHCGGTERFVFSVEDRSNAQVDEHVMKNNGAFRRMSNGSLQKNALNSEIDAAL